VINGSMSEVNIINDLCDDVHPFAAARSANTLNVPLSAETGKQLLLAPNADMTSVTFNDVIFRPFSSRADSSLAAAIYSRRRRGWLSLSRRFIHGSDVFDARYSHRLAGNSAEIKDDRR